MKMSLLIAVLSTLFVISVNAYEIMVDCQVCKSSQCPTKMCLIYNGVGFNNQEYCHNKNECGGYPKPIYSKQCKQSSISAVCNTGCCIEEPNSLKCTDSLQGSQLYCPEEITNQYGMIILGVSLTVVIVSFICICGCIFIRYKFFMEPKLQQKKSDAKNALDSELETNNTQTKLRRNDIFSQSYNQTLPVNDPNVSKQDIQHKIEQIQSKNYDIQSRIEDEIHHNHNLDSQTKQDGSKKVFTFNNSAVEDDNSSFTDKQIVVQMNQQFSFTLKSKKIKKSSIEDLDTVNQSQVQQQGQSSQNEKQSVKSDNVLSEVVSKKVKK